MSGLTGYTVGGQDLSAIFQPIGTLTPVSATGYTVEGKDLSYIFAGVSSGTQISYDTGFKVNNSNYPNIDLRQIFAPYNSLPFSTTGSAKYTYTGGYYTIIFTESGTITFTSPTGNILNTKILAVGGGGGGGGGGGEAWQYDIDTGTGTSPGAGGGGGGIGFLNKTISNNIYTITVGTGGAGLNGSNKGLNGGTSRFIQNTTNYLTATGGGGGGAFYSQTGGGAGGTSTSEFAYTSYNGGKGANASANGTNGSPTNPLMPISVYGTNYYFSGAGAGGTYLIPLGGGAGNAGNGGIALVSSTATGMSAVSNSYGSGGGGGSDSLPGFYGGNGAQGVVIIKFPY